MLRINNDMIELDGQPVAVLRRDLWPTLRDRIEAIFADAGQYDGRLRPTTIDVVPGGVEGDTAHNVPSIRSR